MSQKQDYEVMLLRRSRDVNAGVVSADKEKEQGGGEDGKALKLKFDWQKTGKTAPREEYVYTPGVFPLELHAYIQYTHTHVLVYTHTHTHAHMHAHTHTHTQLC